MDQGNKQLFHQLHIISIKMYNSFFSKSCIEHYGGIYRELDLLNLH